jgi:hypothetical protein
VVVNATETWLPFGQLFEKDTGSHFITLSRLKLRWVRPDGYYRILY